MITLIYVPKPALHKSAKANNDAHNLEKNHFVVYLFMNEMKQLS